MTNSLEEAIKHCEEVAEEKEHEAEHRQETQGDMFKFLNDLSKSVGGEGVEDDILNDCLECAKEHRQLAEWLKELKAYKANRECYCSWCSNLKDRHLRIEYYWIDDEGNTASYVGKTNQVATGIARFCPCCGRFIEMEVNADD